MKVLLRSDYTWHDAKWNPVQAAFNIDGYTDRIIATQIVSVKDDDRNKYVKCKNCGETILNTPSAIKKHYELSKTSKTCLSCGSCRRKNSKMMDEKFIVNDDGSYNITTKTNAELYCNYGFWNGPGIDTEDARKQCKYHRCEAAGMEVYKDIFSKYPGIFDDILTVDVLVKKKWEFVTKESNGDCEFKIPLKFNLYAVVTSKGFIDHFYYLYRNSRFNFMYSPKYAKIIWNIWNGYDENAPREVTSTTIEKITKKIIELYKEAEKND